MSGARAWLISVCTEFHAPASRRVDGRGRPIAVGCRGVTVHPLQARDAAAELASGAGWCDKACTDGEPGLFGADGPEAPKCRLNCGFCWVPPAGFEPATHGLGTRPGPHADERRQTEPDADLRKRASTVLVV